MTRALTFFAVLLMLAGCDSITSDGSEDHPVGPLKATLTSPAADQVVTDARLTIRGTATSDAGITRVSSSLNGATPHHEADITAANSVSFEFDLTELAPGTNHFAIYAYDSAGEQVEVKRSVVYATVQYDVVVVGGLGNGWTRGWGINEAGDIVGSHTPGKTIRE